MKCISKIMLGAVLTLVSVSSFAADKTGKELSADCKKQISAVNTEIKAIKTKQKLEPGNAEYVTQLQAKQAELDVLKGRQIIYDKAAKLEADAFKAQKAAETAKNNVKKAEQKAKDAAKKAEDATKKAEAAIKEANELRK